MALRSENVISICSGVGGNDLGIHLARPSSRIVAYMEREAYAAGVLAARMEDGTLDDAPIWSDLTAFDGSAWRGKVVGITGGFPCQPWSVAGQRKGVADERWIWDDIARIIRNVDPEWCFFENVPGFIRRGLPIILNDFAELGFDAEWGVFSAAEVGAPHRRQRFFILAHARRRGDNEDQPGRQQWASGQGTSRASEVGGVMAHSDKAGWSVERRSSVLDSERQTFGRDADRRSSATANMVDTDSTRLEGRSITFGERSDQQPTWPPGPTSDAIWPEGLEPAVCRMADGLPNRIDRLRACGNGAVPLAVAYAFRTLAARIGLDFD